MVRAVDLLNLHGQRSFIRCRHCLAQFRLFLYADLFQKICQLKHWYRRITVIMLGMCIWLALAVIFRMHKCIALLLYILGYGEICLLLNLYTNGAAEAVFLAQGGGRYLALPQWVFLAAVCIALYDLLKHGTWSMAGILMGVLV